VATSRVAVIARVKTAVTSIACTQTPPANATKQHALQQAETLASRPSENLAVGPVRCEATAIGEELIPGDVTRMVVRNNNTPLILWHLARLSTDLASGADLLARLIPTKHVSAGVRWIRKNADHPRMGQPTPDEFAIPHTAVRSTRKEKTDLVEALNHSVGTVLLLEQREDRPDGTLHFLVGIENDLVVVKYQTNWQRKTQLPLLRSVEFGAVEARANDVQFCLRERAFHAEDKAVVEVGWIVAAISVEHQCLGDSAQFQ